MQVGMDRVGEASRGARLQAAQSLLPGLHNGPLFKVTRTMEALYVEAQKLEAK